MTLYLDTEFNGHGGDPISVALASTGGEHFYVELPLPQSVHPWVAEHVVPRLITDPTPLPEARFNLRYFLDEHRGEVIYADWPDDFAHLMRLMSGPSFEESWMVPCSMRLIVTPAGQPKSDTPHNALSDAIALMEWHQQKATQP